MRRIIFLLLICTLCLSLCACVTSGNAQIDDPSGVFENDANSDYIDNSEKAENNEPVHTHTWINATCTSAKICSSCGATEGNALKHSWKDATCTDPKICTSCNTSDGKAIGHNWKDATCSEPKTCTVCAATSGLTAGHKFSDGKCTHCGKNDPDYVRVTTVWIPTKGGKKYHSNPKCSNMIDPEEVTKSEAESRGFTACKRCY